MGSGSQSKGSGRADEDNKTVIQLIKALPSHWLILWMRLSEPWGLMRDGVYNLLRNTLQRMSLRSWDEKNHEWLSTCKWIKKAAESFWLQNIVGSKSRKMAFPEIAGMDVSCPWLSTKFGHRTVTNCRFSTAFSTDTNMEYAHRSSQLIILTWITLHICCAEVVSVSWRLRRIDESEREFLRCIWVGGIPEKGHECKWLWQRCSTCHPFKGQLLRRHCWMQLPNGSQRQWHERIKLRNEGN